MSVTSSCDTSSMTCSCADHSNLTIDLNEGEAENLRGAKALAEATRATRRAMISCILTLY